MIGVWVFIGSATALFLILVVKFIFTYYDIEESHKSEKERGKVAYKFLSDAMVTITDWGIANSKEKNAFVKMQQLHDKLPRLSDLVDGNRPMDLAVYFTEEEMKEVFNA